MNNNEQSKQRLSEQLSDIDADILAQAYDVDSAEKMRELCRGEACARSARVRGRIVRRAAVVCACFLLVVSMVLTLPAMLRGPGTGDGDVLPPVSDDTPLSPPKDDGLQGAPEIYPIGFIDSLDKLNYYAAMRLIENEKNPLAASLIPSYRFDFLVASDASDGNGADEDHGYGAETPPEYGEDTPPEYEGDGEISGGSADATTPPAQGQAPENGESVWYYALHPDETFTISQTVFFQIEILDEKGFLASRVGTGIVDVVITVNSLDHMITFKNGDRFYSCLNNGAGGGKMDFSSHKYIDGFYIVKNLSQDNCRFDVFFDGQGLVCGMTCSYFKMASGDPSFVPDEVTVIPGSSYTSYAVSSVTINELNAYYQTPSIPEDGGKQEPPADGYSPDDETPGAPDQNGDVPVGNDEPVDSE